MVVFIVSQNGMRGCMPIPSFETRHFQKDAFGQTIGIWNQSNIVTNNSLKRVRDQMTVCEFVQASCSSLRSLG
jgi:hypothetical protein